MIKQPPPTQLSIASLLSSIFEIILSEIMYPIPIVINCNIINPEVKIAKNVKTTERVTTQFLAVFPNNELREINIIKNN